VDRVVRIGERALGGPRCYVIAEAGVNHNGDSRLAHALIDAAADAGADAVKFQTFVADRLVTAAAPKAGYQEQRGEAGETQRDMLRRLELSAAAHVELRDHARESGIEFLSTAFDEGSVDLLAGLPVAAFKIPSGEITNTLLLSHVAAQGRPVMLSTGMSSLDEVRDAVAVLRGAGCVDLVLLQCTSAYPADPRTANLRAMRTMAREFDVLVGYSDHTPGIAVALAAAALGAAVIEKHLTLDRALPGPDHEASLEPDQFAHLVTQVRIVEQALGDGVKQPAAPELELARLVRRSIVAAHDLPAGVRLTASMLTVKRPGTGLPPAALSRIVGRRLRRAVAADAIVEFDMIDEANP
jgi:N-acetylneuraminate synthase